MPESFPGDGLIFEESLPVSWTPGPVPGGLELARLNADNQQLLGAESSLDEVRIHEMLKDESPALVHELQRLEYKLNILLRLTADIYLRSSAMPPRRYIRLSASGMEWFGGDAPAAGTGMLRVYINAALPQPLLIPSEVLAVRREKDEAVSQLGFTGLSEAVVMLLDKLIFRHHRRMVAGAKLAPH